MISLGDIPLSLLMRKLGSTTLAQITAFNREEVSTFYENLFSLFEKYRFSQYRIFNTDNISTVRHPGRIFDQIGEKWVSFVTNEEKARTTRMRNGPPGAIYILCTYVQLFEKRMSR